MLSTESKSRCSRCEKERAISKCTGCSKDFCYHHLTAHRRELSRQFDHIQVTHDLFKQNLNEQSHRCNDDAFVRQINQWEKDSIKLVQQTANECRDIVMERRHHYFEQIKMNLKAFMDEVRENRQEDEFDEIDLHQLKEEFKQIQQQLHQPMNLSIQHELIPLVNRISVVVSSRQTHTTSLREESTLPCAINENLKWKQHGSTVAGGNDADNLTHQLHCPQGICLDDDEDGQKLYIADYENHRIVEWIRGEKNGRIVAGGNGQGNRTDQLNNPTDVILDRNKSSLIICDAGNRRVVRWSHQHRTYQQTLVGDIDCIGVAMDKHGDLYVSDCVKNEVRRWKQGETTGTLVAGGHGKGDDLNQLSCATFVVVDDDQSVYVSDCNNNRVMKWPKDATEGIVVAGGHGPGNALTQLCLPQGLVVDPSGNIYVADSLNHRIMRHAKDSQEGTVIVGGNGEGDDANQFDCCVSLAFDRQGNLYAADYHNHRVQKFDVDSD